MHWELELEVCPRVMILPARAHSQPHFVSCSCSWAPPPPSLPPSLAPLSRCRAAAALLLEAHDGWLAGCLAGCRTWRSLGSSFVREKLPMPEKKKKGEEGGSDPNLGVGAAPPPRSCHATVTACDLGHCTGLGLSGVTRKRVDDPLRRPCVLIPVMFCSRSRPQCTSSSHD